MLHVSVMIANFATNGRSAKGNNMARSQASGPSWAGWLVGWADGRRVGWDLALGWYI
jgi:hypothetical protein